MKFSINWLKDFVDISLGAQELADQLSLRGHEVDAVIFHGQKLHQIHTGRIESIEKHPEADRLVITQIFDGKINHQILTAATNIKVGDIIPFSFPGSVLANGTKIKSTNMRGIESHGMLCSEQELGVAETSEGIWILPADTPLGIDFIEHAFLKDEVLDIGVLPNRGDCLSIYGLARDISAIFNVPLRHPDTTITRTQGESGIKLSIEAASLCPLYTGQFIQGVKQTPSPQWMQRRLMVCGVRSINLAVDITNYVLLELGQPLHAFDHKSLTTKEIKVRLAKDKEPFSTLDGTKRSLSSQDLVVCNGETPAALGGIMGGLDSEIKEHTQDIYLESAIFDATSVRKSALALVCRTEGAIRFEKGTDPEGIVRASERAAHLYQTLSGAKITGPLDVFKNEQHDVFKSTSIQFSADQLNSFLGTSFSEDIIRHTLGALSIKLNKELTKADIPSWRRQDLTEYPCLAEEVSRIQGFDQVPVTLPTRSVIVESETRLSKLQETAASFLVHQGFYETNTYPMVSPEDHRKLGLPVAPWTLQNPMSVEESVMRETLVSSLLKVMAHNQNRKLSPLFFFEMAKTYHLVEGKLKEEHHLVAIVNGSKLENPYLEKDKTVSGVSLFDLKQWTETLLAQFGLKKWESTPGSTSYSHPKQWLEYRFVKTAFAQIGLLHPSIAQAYDISGSVGVIDLNLSVISELPVSQVKYTPYSKFPSNTRDIALLVPRSVTYDALLKTMDKVKSKRAISISLFDVFESEKLGPDHSSLAFSVTYQDPEKTLSDDEVNTEHQAFCDTLTQRLPVTIR